MSSSNMGSRRSSHTVRDAFDSTREGGRIATDDMSELGFDSYLINLNLPLYKSLTKKMQAEYLENFDALDMLSALQDVKRELAAVKLENYYLIDFLEKNDPKLLVGMRKKLDRESEGGTTTGAVGSKNVSPHSSIGSTQSRMSRRSNATAATLSMSQSITNASSIVKKVEYRLNYRAKTEMTEKTSADVQRRVRALEENAMKVRRTLNAELEELKFRIEEIDGTTASFHLHFLNDDRDLRFLEKATEKQIERRLTKFVGSWVKNARSLLGTMRLRITTVQGSCQMHRSGLIAKADLSGILGTIDFEQLKIKRTEYQKSLDEKNANMVGLKGVTGKASMAMSVEKQEMMNIEAKSQKITNKTLEVIRQISKLEKETQFVEEENKRAINTLSQLKDQLRRFDAPSVGDYIDIKNELRDLEKEDRLLQRKIPILSMKLSNLVRECKRRDMNRAVEEEDDDDESD